MKNGRWFLVTPAAIEGVGWGDLSFADLDDIAEALRAFDAVFVACPEDVRGSSDSAVSATQLAQDALYAVMDGEVRFVDAFGLANRRGAVWLERGHRYARSGRRMSTGRRRVSTITPSVLADRIAAMTGTAA